MIDREAFIFENEAAFKALFQSASIGMVIVDEHGLIKNINPEALNMFGYEKLELLDKPVGKIVPRSLRKKHKEHLSGYFINPKVRSMGESMELFALHKKGSSFPVEISLGNFQLDSKNLAVAYITNITNRKQAENDTKEQSRKFQTLIGNLPGMVYRCKNDKNWTMEFISERCLPITGYTHTEFISGKIHVGELILDENKDYVWDSVQAALKDKRTFNLLYQIKSKNGEIKWISEEGEGVYNEDGCLIALEGFLTDVTERQKATIALNESEARFRLAAQGASAGIWEWNIITGKERWSDTYYRLLGYEPGEIESTFENFTHHLLHPDDLQPMFKILDRHLKFQKTFTIEYRIKTKTGGYKWFFGSGQAEWNEKGEPINMAGSIIDINERKVVEKEIQQLNKDLELKVEERTKKLKEQGIALEKSFQKIEKQKKELEFSYKKLKELDEFKQGMTSMIVHDFKNHLNNIINYSEKIPDLIQTKSIHQAGNLMLNMVHNMLDVQKFEETKVDFKKEINPITQVVKTALDEVKFMLERKSIKFHHQIEKQLYAFYDFDLVLRVFVNLFTNAIKYTEANGNIYLNVQEREGFIYISIKDTGQGIPIGKQKYIFDKFSQVDAKKYGNVRSTGLGLTYCKMVIEAHGGEIGVYSEEGEGAIFWFTLQKATQPKEIDAKKVNIEINFLKEKEIILTEEDKKLLTPYIRKLKELEVYDFSDVKDIIVLIEKNKTPGINDWLSSINNAIENLNEKKFEMLLNK